MRKLIRPSYPASFSLGILLLIFVLSFFLSHQLFKVPIHDLDEHHHVQIGMSLVAAATILMLLIIWEELLFPIKVKEIKGGMVYRNHRKKLRTQILIYLVIPAIFLYIYSEYEVIHFRFFIWAGICVLAPIFNKLASGINNYNDFLKLTLESIEFKNNEKEGSILTKDIHHITMIKDTKNIVHKMELSLINHQQIHIDLDEMELEAFYDSIQKFIATNYKHLIKETNLT